MSDQGDIKTTEAEKLELISRLAGGIAHDYNNLLAVILLHADILMNVSDDAVRRHAREIKYATQRANAVTRQLQAFGGAPLMRPVRVSLNEQINKISGVLESILNPKSKLHTRLEERVGLVDVDPVYLELILTNLVNNARDAMPDAGEVTITTEVVDESQARITITDTGSGMDAQTRERAVEPFFSTRKSKRHGLGLSTVYAVIKQMAGTVSLHSEPNKGTSIEIYLPQHELAQPSEAAEDLLHGSETILLVDDEAMLRNLTCEILEVFGYEVLDAAGGYDALEICEECSQPVALLLVDLEMDDMDGIAVAAAVRKKWANVPVLFMSGLSEQAVWDLGLPTYRTDFIGKPFEPDDLTRRIRRLIDHHPQITQID
ncbi:MAG TPA: ATP-binding protein [Pyrinomonadaceae bacterium]|nr:ATP-binding protein [Pyrinomonadaceae bacterium]